MAEKLGLIAAAAIALTVAFRLDAILAAVERERLGRGAVYVVVRVVQVCGLLFGIALLVGLLRLGWWLIAGARYATSMREFLLGLFSLTLWTALIAVFVGPFVIRDKATASPRNPPPGNEE